MGSSTTTRIAAAVIVAGLVIVLLVQLLVPLAGGGTASDATGRVLGKTGFAYLGGLRTFVAALLWNRLDPQFHEYYGGDVVRSLYMLPSIRLVTWLDPQFVQAYYVAQWVVARNGHVPEALALTREGIAANPRSGLLRASYAQMMLLFANDRVAAHSWAVRTLASDALWADADEEFQGYATIRDVLRITGDKAAYQKATAVWQKLKDAGHQLGDPDVPSPSQGAKTVPAPSGAK